MEKRVGMRNKKTIDNLENKKLLRFIDGCLAKKVTKWFTSKMNSFDSSVVLMKLIVDDLIEMHPKTVAEKSVAILDALVYKMSAPYKHMMFWRSTRRVFKDMNKLNSITLIDDLKHISEKFTKSDMMYALNDAAINYLAATYLAMAVRTQRLVELSVQAGKHCLQYMSTGHLLHQIMLLFTLNADIHHELKSHFTRIKASYDRLSPVLTDLRLLAAKAILKKIERSYASSSIKLPSVQGTELIAKACGIDIKDCAELFNRQLLYKKKGQMTETGKRLTFEERKAVEVVRARKIENFEDSENFATLNENKSVNADDSGALTVIASSSQMRKKSTFGNGKTLSVRHKKAMKIKLTKKVISSETISVKTGTDKILEDFIPIATTLQPRNENSVSGKTQERTKEGNSFVRSKEIVFVENDVKIMDDKNISSSTAETLRKSLVCTDNKSADLGIIMKGKKRKRRMARNRKKSKRRKQTK